MSKTVIELPKTFGGGKKVTLDSLSLFYLIQQAWNLSEIVRLLDPDTKRSDALVTTRLKLAAFSFLSIGTNDTILLDPCDVFRLAIVANCRGVMVCHNHPSGDPTPSDGDIRVTRDLLRGGQLLKIGLLDHIILGNPAFGYERSFSSLKQLGYLAL